MNTKIIALTALFSIAAIGGGWAIGNHFKSTHIVNSTIGIQLDMPYNWQVETSKKSIDLTTNGFIPLHKTDSAGHVVAQFFLLHVPLREVDFEDTAADILDRAYKGLNLGLMLKSNYPDSKITANVIEPTHVIKTTLGETAIRRTEYMLDDDPNTGLEKELSVNRKSSALIIFSQHRLWDKESGEEIDKMEASLKLDNSDIQDLLAK